MIEVVTTARLAVWIPSVVSVRPRPPECIGASTKRGYLWYGSWYGPTWTNTKMKLRTHAVLTHSEINTERNVATKIARISGVNKDVTNWRPELYASVGEIATWTLSTAAAMFVVSRSTLPFEPVSSVGFALDEDYSRKCQLLSMRCRWTSFTSSRTIDPIATTMKMKIAATKLGNAKGCDCQKWCLNIGNGILCSGCDSTWLRVWLADCASLPEIFRYRLVSIWFQWLPTDWKHCECNSLIWLIGQLSEYNTACPINKCDQYGSVKLKYVFAYAITPPNTPINQRVETNATVDPLIPNIDTDTAKLHVPYTMTPFLPYLWLKYEVGRTDCGIISG